jgi:hypothetical protein
MSLLQVAAACAAGVERLVFQTVTPDGRAEFDLAMEKMRRQGLESAATAAQVIALTE